MAPESLCGAAAAKIDTAAYRVRPFHVSTFVHDGARIDLGDRTLEVMRVPGHAPDAVALLDRAHGLLFTGDTFYEGPIYIFGAGADPAAFTRSAARLGDRHARREARHLRVRPILAGAAGEVNEADISDR